MYLITVLLLNDIRMKWIACSSVVSRNDHVIAVAYGARLRALKETRMQLCTRFISTVAFQVQQLPPNCVLNDVDVLLNIEQNSSLGAFHSQETATLKFHVGRRDTTFSIDCAWPISIGKEVQSGHIFRIQNTIFDKAEAPSYTYSGCSRDTHQRWI